MAAAGFEATLWVAFEMRGVELTCLVLLLLLGAVMTILLILMLWQLGRRYFNESSLRRLRERAMRVLQR